MNFSEILTIKNEFRKKFCSTLLSQRKIKIEEKSNIEKSSNYTMKTIKTPDVSKIPIQIVEDNNNEEIDNNMKKKAK